MTGVSVADARDLPSLVELEACFPPGQRWSPDSWRDELAAANRHVVVCRDGDEIVAAATFSLSGDVVDLHRIVTAPMARRQGQARQLLAAGSEWAKTSGAVRMLLEVDATNAPALALYESEGFRRIAERRDYYGPGAHAVILEETLSEGELS